MKLQNFNWSTHGKHTIFIRQIKNQRTRNPNIQSLDFVLIASLPHRLGLPPPPHERANVIRDESSRCNEKWAKTPSQNQGSNSISFVILFCTKKLKWSHGRCTHLGSWVSPRLDAKFEKRGISLKIIAPTQKLISLIQQQSLLANWCVNIMCVVYSIADLAYYIFMQYMKWGFLTCIKSNRAL